MENLHFEAEIPYLGFLCECLTVNEYFAEIIQAVPLYNYKATQAV